MADVAPRLVAALADRYRLEREVGAGGMATVYLAHDLKHERDVAIKVLHPDLAAALGGERFLSEIKTTAKLQHPHILPLLDSGSADGFLFYVMPYVAGETLRSRLERERQLPLDDALRIAREVADALGSAHAIGIIHRDIKPENILLQGGHALVADFGIALAVQSAGGARMTQTGLSLGTPQYMSPEQAMGERSIDARADQYALGAVTYEMIAGEPPFTGASVQAIIAKALSERPVPLRTLRDTVPPAVEAAVLKAIAKLPADRFATVSDFSFALAAGSTVDAAAWTGATQARRSEVRFVSPGRFVLAAGALVALVVLAKWVSGLGVAPTIVAIFDAALPDSAPMSRQGSIAATGFGATKSNLSIAPDGSFFVYSVQRGDSSQLWYRSLVDASARAIPGTNGGSAPRVSPDGQRVAFISGDRTMIAPIIGGEPRRLMDDDAPVTLQWVSPTRLFAINGGGFRFVWIDPEVGVVEDRTLPRASRCVYGQWLADDQALLCSFNETAVLVDPKTGVSQSIRTRAKDGTPGAPVSGVSFRLVDGAYMLYLSLDGDLRAAPYDRREHLLGRSVSLVTGINRDALGGAQYDLTTSGLLGYVPSSGDVGSRMVVLRPGAAPVPLPLEPAKFLRFDLNRDRRRLAAVVATHEGQELRIYDLLTGQIQTWLRADNIRFSLWNPAGDKIAVRVEDHTGAVLLYGSPTSSSAPDTLMSGPRADAVHDVFDFADDHTILTRDGETSAAYRIDIVTRPVRVDTIFADALFATVAPGGKRIAYHAATAGGLRVSAYPLASERLQVSSIGIEPLWLSSDALLFRSSVTWYLARFDARSGELTGPPVKWGQDLLFADTPGWSNRLSHDGGIIYAQTQLMPDARFLRFVPDFVTRMKAAVREANK